METKLLTVIAMFFLTITMHAQQIRPITSNNVDNLIKSNPKIVILDVRTPAEFSKGHVKGAINIDVRQNDAFSKVDKLDKDKTYLVYCHTKNRSGVMTNYMINTKFKNVIQMTDGMAGWENNKLPLDR